MLKVLIVDDEEVVRRGIVLGIDWAALGCVIAGEAANGIEGMEAARKYEPNLIITDVRMPQMDGLTMISKLREEGIRCQAIVLTAYSDFDYVRQALRFGAVDYLLKPFRNQDLIAAVQKASQQEEESSGKTTPIRLPKKGDKSGMVLDAMNYIGAHYQEAGLGISEIAGAVGVSEGHLSHAFKKETDYTVIGYLTLYRIHEAMKKLEDPRCRIYEVAEAVGYRDVAYFCSVFKKQTGMSPTDYQKTQRTPGKRQEM